MRISDVEIPADAAAEDEAPLTECALKIDVSMPEASNKDLSHLATVLEDTAFCGLTIATSSLVYLPRRDFVLSSYSLRVDTGHSLLFSGREGKKDSLILSEHPRCVSNMAKEVWPGRLL